MKMTKKHGITLFVVLLLVIDQITKILVKTNMTIGQSINVLGDWFQIYFVENPGMAFGMEFGGDIGKLSLTIIRIILITFLIIYLRRILKKGETPKGVIIGITMILAGAMGNVIDCLFYGVLFDASTFTQVAQFMPEGGGYAPVLFGKVVDMLYFPIIDTTLPSWVPIWGGENFVFFRAIFNLADSYVTCGAFYLIIFKWKFFSSKSKN